MTHAGRHTGLAPPLPHGAAGIKRDRGDDALIYFPIIFHLAAVYFTISCITDTFITLIYHVVAIYSLSG